MIKIINYASVTQHWILQKKPTLHNGMKIN